MLSTLQNISLPDLTEGWNRCWQGYYYNMHYQQEHMKAWLTLGHIDLSHSIGLFHQNKLVGLSLLSIDEEDGWIAGACIDPEYRGKKLFPQLMLGQISLAKALGLKSLFLEVFEQNHIAIKVYEQVGFSRIRPLHIFKVQMEEMPMSIRDNSIEPHLYYSVSPDFYFNMRNQAQFTPAWQRRDNFLLRYPNLTPFLSKNHTSGYLIGGKHHVLLDAWSNSVIESQHIITAIVNGHKTFAINNQPLKDQLCHFFLYHEIRPTDTQYEMVLKLA